MRTQEASSNPQGKSPGRSRGKTKITLTLEQAEEKVQQLNALEGFERWRLLVLGTQYQMLDLLPSGKVRWKSFRRESLRAVVGWAAQQTNARRRTHSTSGKQDN
jgi:hypothetical protein